MHMEFNLKLVLDQGNSIKGCFRHHHHRRHRRRLHDYHIGSMNGWLLSGWSLKTMAYAINLAFLHDRPWISTWIKSISDELDITIHVMASQFSRYCDVISNRLWRHHRRPKERHTATMCKYISWRTVSALTRVLFLYLFPSLLRNSGNKHKNERAIGDCVLAKICHSFWPPDLVIRSLTLKHFNRYQTTYVDQFWLRSVKSYDLYQVERNI